MLARVGIVACLVVAGFAATIDDCPSGIKRDEYLKVHGDICYQFHLNERRTFQDAEDYCVNHGGQLAMVKSESVDQYLRDTIKNTYVIYYSPVWIGLKSQSDQFHWVDGSKMSFNHVDESDISEDSDVCIALSPESVDWFAYECESYFFISQKNRFICQFPARETSTPTTGLCPVKSDNEKAVQELEDKCYYFEVDESLSFPKAEAFCEKYGGKLALVKSEKINNFLQHHLAVTHNKGSSVYGFWIGLKYSDSQESYHWVDGTSVHFSNFDKYSSYKGKCVTLSPSDGQWNRDYCTDYAFDSRHFICEFDKTSTGVQPTETTNPKTTKGVAPTDGLVLPTVPATNPPPPTSKPKGKCPVGSGDSVQTLDGKCYYFDLGDSLTFQQAEAFCEKYGGTLVMPKSQKVNEFLQHHLHVTHKMGYSSKSLWIGLKKSKTYYPFKWVDGTAIDYMHFRTKSSAVGCAAISPTDGEWENASCYENSIYGDSKHFICQF